MSLARPAPPRCYSCACRVNRWGLEGLRNTKNGRIFFALPAALVGVDVLSELARLQHIEHLYIVLLEGNFPELATAAGAVPGPAQQPPAAVVAGLSVRIAAEDWLAAAHIASEFAATWRQQGAPCSLDLASGGELMAAQPPSLAGAKAAEPPQAAALASHFFRVDCKAGKPLNKAICREAAGLFAAHVAAATGWQVSPLPSYGHHIITHYTAAQSLSPPRVG